jgi:hypothetical protein
LSFERNPDQMAEIPESLVILIVIAGAAFSVLLGYAMFRFFVSTEEQGIRDMPNEQKEYMREVRRRNKGWNYFEARTDRRDRRYTESTVE